VELTRDFHRGVAVRMDITEGITDRQLIFRGTYFSVAEICWKKISKTKKGPLKAPNFELNTIVFTRRSNVLKRLLNLIVIEPNRSFQRARVPSIR
jgi:hypothetical protein